MHEYYTKKFPPFGKKINEMRQRGEIPSLLPIMIVFNWDYAKSFPRILIDPSTKPSSYRFNFLAALPVQICAAEADMPLVGELVAELIKSHPSEITLFRFADVGTARPACSVLYSQNHFSSAEAA